VTRSSGPELGTFIVDHGLVRPAGDPGVTCSMEGTCVQDLQVTSMTACEKPGLVASVTLCPARPMARTGRADRVTVIVGLDPLSHAKDS
jgi:hypothetical protein